MEEEIRKRAEESGADKRLPDIFRQRNFGEGGRRTKTVIRRGENIFLIRAAGYRVLPSIPVVACMR
jgi:hypothetical protein